VITLFDAARCPYCARVRIVLAEKGVEYETVEIDLTDRPAWIYEKNPTGTVPVIEEDGFVLPESEVIMEYLEERYPEPALLPADAADRAAVRYRIDRFDAELGDAYYAFKRGEADRLDLSRLEPTHGYTLADIAYVPWLVRARDMLGVDLPPRVAEWVDRLAERPAVAAELEVVAAL
jgi:glutathione S-transferase